MPYETWISEFDWEDLKEKDLLENPPMEFNGAYGDDKCEAIRSAERWRALGYFAEVRNGSE